MAKVDKYIESVFKDLELQFGRPLTDEEKALFIAGMSGAAAILQSSCNSLLEDTKRIGAEI